jgi:uncharacterized integral membrane protein (TIGR00698 family)
MKKEFIPGWSLMLLVGLAATLLGKMKLIEIGGKNPIEAAFLAIVLSVLFRNLGLVPKACYPGIKAFEKILILGIVLLGASLNFKSIGSQGASMLVIVLVTMLISFFVIYFLGKVFKLPPDLAVLLAVGTTICGGTAIAVTAPLIKAEEKHIGYAFGTIALWGFVAILFYPVIAQFAGVTDISFGVFAGTAIHSTPQVIGAGFAFSELAGKTATAVKLVRNCFMVPLAFFIVIWYTRNILKSRKKEGIRVKDIARAFPWFLFGYFIMAALNTWVPLPPETAGVKDLINTAGKFLVISGLAGIGFNTSIRAIKEVGLKPLGVGFIGAVVVAGCSIAMISLLL